MMYEVEVGVEIRRYCTVKVTVEDPEEAYQLAEAKALEEDLEASWNEPEVSYSEILRQIPLETQDILADTIHEAQREALLAG